MLKKFDLRTKFWLYFAIVCLLLMDEKAGATKVLAAWNLHRICALLAHLLLISYTFVMNYWVCTYDFAELRCRILASHNGDRSWWDQSLIVFVSPDHIEIRESLSFVFYFLCFVALFQSNQKKNQKV